MPSQYEHDDPQDFLDGVRQSAKKCVAVVVEYFTCQECKSDQFCMHAFKEVMECGECGHRNASVVPRIPMPGEVTKEILSLSIDVIRQAVPPVSLETRKWLNDVKGAAGTLVSAAYAEGARDALDQVRHVSRDITRGHHPTGELHE